MISRFKPSVWIVAVTSEGAAFQGLAFSYGVYPVQLADDPEEWQRFSRDWLREHQVPGKTAMLVSGPSPRHPDASHRLEFLRVEQQTQP